MGMDRNTVIGFILIGALLIGMFIINSKGRLAYEGEQKRIADSIAAARSKADTSTTASIHTADTTHVIALQSDFGGTGDAAMVTMENEVLKVTFSSKGAHPVRVELKKYTRYNGEQVVLQQGDFNKLSYDINTGINKTNNTEDRKSVV